MTATDQELEIGLDPWERNWIRFTIALLIVFASTITVAGFFMGFQVPGADQEVDPTTVTQSGPFAEPGLRDLGDGRYDAYVVARMFQYDMGAPTGVLEIPLNAEVTFYVTSTDLQHGFNIRDTNINMQIVPGQVSKLTHTFDEVGDFPLICNEYCGLGHALMASTIRVVSDAGAEGQQ